MRITHITKEILTLCSFFFVFLFAVLGNFIFFVVVVQSTVHTIHLTFQKETEAASLSIKCINLCVSLPDTKG